MCGIIGAVAQRDVAPILLEGLKRLEYRGYDSAGIATIHEDKMYLLRRMGKVNQLVSSFEKHPIFGSTGIAHTRWATHGEPSEINAHPHTSSGDIAIVHNGIIENHDELRQYLNSEIGYQFDSDTDTEVIAHLIHHLSKTSSSLLNAVISATKKFTGAYGVAVMDRRDPSHIIAARSGSPLVIGKGISEMFVASDQLALLPVTRQFLYLEEGEIAKITRDSVTIFNSEGEEIDRSFEESKIQHDINDKGEYRHYILKEMFEQPQVVANTLEGRIFDNKLKVESFDANAQNIFNEIEAVKSRT